MNTITVRGLDPEISKALKQLARERGLSINRLVLDLLKDHLGLGQPKPEHHDLDKFFGTWSKDELQGMMKSVRSQRKIDKELWE